jgi:hypothetical protein
MTTDKGLSYVPQIKAAYADLLSAHANKLTCALRFADVLNQARETIGKGAWGPWLKLHFPEISHSTANVYMNLGNHKEIVEAYSQHAVKMGTERDLSIRGAIEEVRLALGKEKKQKTPKPKAPVVEQDDDPEEGVLATLDVDEVLTGIQQEWEPHQRTKLLTEQLKSTQPFDVARLLGDVWNPEKIQELMQELSVRLPKPSPKPLDRRLEARPTA